MRPLLSLMRKGQGALFMMRSPLRASMHSLLRLSSLSRLTLVSTSSLLNSSLPTVGQLQSVVTSIPENPSSGDLDDLTKYALLPVETNLDLDVLEWWKARDHDKPADPATGRPAGLPHMAKMARQFLGRPATSAGVERMFSKAGKLHDDMKKGQEDDSLEHSLIAAANSE